MDLIERNPMQRIMIGALAALLPLAAANSVAATGGAAERDVLLGAAVEDTEADTATLRIARGVDAGGQTFWYVVTEASDKETAARLDVNRSDKLKLVRDTGAAQRGRYIDGVLHLAATVDFSPVRIVTPDPTIGFPPLAAQPGAIGEAGYSPLVQLPNGVVLNAPHIANNTGTHDKLVGSIDFAAGTATFQESEGFYDGEEVYYVSFESSAPDVAALEAATYAPALNAAPGLGSNDKKTSARSGIAPFANGQTGVDNPNRQGLNSALLGEGDPLNVVESLPESNRYSPLWDVHLAVWSDAAVAAGANTVQIDFGDIEDLAEGGLITGPGGSFDAVGIIVNCPIISIVD
jgi:hypothetical protein